MGLYDFTFYDLINRNARAYNNRPAWLEVKDGRALTYGQFKETVDRLASGLQQRGIEKGDRIGVVGKNSLEFFLLYGAAAALGAIVVPINWRLSVEEAHFNLNDVEPRILFVDPEFQEMMEVSITNSGPTSPAWPPRKILRSRNITPRGTSPTSEAVALSWFGVKLK